MGIIDSFKETVAFFDSIRKEGFIVDYALIGGLALSAWVRPRTTRDVDLIVAISEQTACRFLREATGRPSTGKALTD